MAFGDLPRRAALRHVPSQYFLVLPVLRGGGRGLPHCWQVGGRSGLVMNPSVSCHIYSTKHYHAGLPVARNRSDAWCSPASRRLTAGCTPGTAPGTSWCCAGSPAVQVVKNSNGRPVRLGTGPGESDRSGGSAAGERVGADVVGAAAVVGELRVGLHGQHCPRRVERAVGQFVGEAELVRGQERPAA
jgi:hypothetical protein